MPRDSHVHSDFILAIDVGNTAVHMGVFMGETISKERRVSTEKMDEQVILELAEETDAFVISSVVPSATLRLSRLSNRLGQRAVVVDHSLDLGIEILCDEPAQIGSDRLCNAVAACSKYGTPSVVIDFGTAITFDVLKSGGRYVGGQILPGPALQAWVLHEKTAKLPLIDVVPPERSIGSDTEGAMRAGIYLGTLGAVRAIHDAIREEIGGGTVIVTGGGMDLFASALGVASVCDPHLTLEGARLIYERNKD